MTILTPFFTNFNIFPKIFLNVSFLYVYCMSKLCLTFPKSPISTVFTGFLYLFFDTFFSLIFLFSSFFLVLLFWFYAIFVFFPLFFLFFPCFFMHFYHFLLISLFLLVFLFIVFHFLCSLYSVLLQSCRCIAHLSQQHSLLIYSVHYFTKTRPSLSKICVCTSSGRIFFIGRTFL